MSDFTHYSEWAHGYPRPERVATADLVSEARRLADWHDEKFKGLAHGTVTTLTALVGALESERETVSDLRVLVGAHLREKKATRAALEDTAAKLDRAHAALREIEACDGNTCFGCKAKARDRLENP